MRAIITGLLFATLCATAQAQDKIESSVTTQTEDGGTVTNVSFDYADCEEECNLASITCTPSGSFVLDLADIPAEAVGKALPLVEKQIVLTIGGKPFDFTMQSMTFAEMTGAWWITAPMSPGEPRDMAAAFAAASSLEIKVDTHAFSLPVDDKVKAWAAACK